ncbi:hypothetical protein ACTHAM_001054 [Cellulomonas soli]|uniref:hypothetical protein n=1 Tax=Cellulomonas soli TaxID=931535 RepID=UPI003F86C19B
MAERTQSAAAHREARMTTLKLDPAALEATAQDLQVVANEFTAADANGEAAAALR